MRLSRVLLFRFSRARGLRGRNSGTVGILGQRVGEGGALVLPGLSQAMRFKPRVLRGGESAAGVSIESNKSATTALLRLTEPSPATLGGDKPPDRSMGF